MSGNNKNKKKHYGNARRLDAEYNPPYSAEQLSLLVDGLNLTETTLNALKAANIVTVRDLAIRTVSDMYRVQNFGKKNFNEISIKLNALNVNFKPEAPNVVSDGATEGGSANRTEPKRDGTEGAAVNKGERNARNAQQSVNNGQPRNGQPRKNDGQQRNNNDAQRNNDGQPRNDRRRSDDKRQAEDRRGNNRPQTEQRTDREVGGNRRPTEDAGDKNRRREDNNNRGKQQDRGQTQGQKGGKQDNSYSSRRLFPRAPFEPTPPVPMEKDRFTKFQRVGKWGFKDENGKEVIPPIYDEVFSFKEDYACVEKNDLFGYINRSNELTIPYKYICAGSFSSGLACVSLSEKCGYINPEDEVVIPFIYEAGTAFGEDGTARAKKDGKWGILTKSGSFSLL